MSGQPRPRPRFSDLVTSLVARQSGSEPGQYMGLCPAHLDRHPSLSLTVRGGRILLHCFAGCEFEKIVAALDQRGLWPVEIDQPENPARHDDAGLPPGLVEFDAELRRPEKGRVERYLRERGIDLGQLDDIAYHHQAFHAPSGQYWPCMVAAVRDVTGHGHALHRTYLSYTDPPRKAAIEPVRMLWGPARGFAIHLAPAAREMVVAEGIETTASAMKLLDLPGWSAISASNMRRVELPEIVREVVIAADNDVPGIAAATAAAQRFRREGRRVRVIRPSRPDTDFNDLLLRGREQ